MKNSIRTMFVVLAIVMSLITVQDVLADSVTVTGTIDEISTRPNEIVVNGAKIFGVRLNYLATQYGIVLETGIAVSVDVYEYECADGTIKLMACKITVDDVTVAVRPCL